MENDANANIVRRIRRCSVDKLLNPRPRISASHGAGRGYDLSGVYFRILYDCARTFGVRGCPLCRGADASALALVAVVTLEAHRPGTAPGPMP